MVGKVSVDRKPREQVNLVLAADSPLARRLREAERVTGWARTQIARDVLDAFLDVWVSAELAKQRIIEAALASISVQPTGGTIGRLRPRYTGEDRPEPDYADVAAARRRLPPHVVAEDVRLEVAAPVYHRPRARRLEAKGPARDYE